MIQFKAEKAIIILFLSAIIYIFVSMRLAQISVRVNSPLSDGIERLMFSVGRHNPIYNYNNNYRA